MAKETHWQKFLLILISVVAAIGGFLFGYDTGVISGAILFIKQEYAVSPLQESWIVSIVSLGAMAGALLAGPINDRFGRKKVVIVSSILFILSALALAWSPTVSWIIIGRLIVGIAIGVTSATAPVYIAELSPRSMRGALVSLNQLCITIGILIAYLAGYAFASVSGWREMFAVAAIPAAIQLICMIFFPESPRYLVTHGKTEKAQKILERFRGSPEDARLECEHIVRVDEEEGKLPGRAVFSKAVRPALIAGVGLTVIQQVTGINTIIYFAPTIFKFAGFASNKSAIFASLFVGIVNVLMTFLAIYLLDRWGRKPLLLLGLSGMVVSLGFLGGGFLFPAQDAIVGWVTLIAMLAYIACFAFSLGPIGWLINSEIYPLKIRGRAMGIATCANWIANFAVTLTFLLLINNIGKSFTFWLYGLIGLFGIYFIIKMIPETKFKSLEEIEEFFKK
ncbi:MAG: putative metabolite transport protein CsbC [Chlamydiia bacterium]|nr:putative metabolite transport protein CsbC [Chlamydiia bacterium]MCH9615012.1 putative metabolite transport protein CsbC [Chlamydiia bacterium]MCH9629937.1 putative metabolite transport protein CsbC [Chlamydiia bacterium]